MAINREHPPAWFHRVLAHSYTVATLCVLVALAIVQLFPIFRERGALLLFLAAVVVSTSYGGWRSGLLAILLAGIAAAWFVLPPLDSPAVTSGADMVRLLLFFVIAALLSYVYASRMAAQQKQKLAEQRLLVAMEAAHMGAWESNFKTGAFWWSPGLERIFGRAPGDFSHSYEGFLGYIHPEDRDFVDRAITRTMDDGMDFEIEHRITRPNKTECVVVTRGRIFYDEDNRAERMIAVAVDVTDKRRLSNNSDG